MHYKRANLCYIVNIFTSPYLHSSVWCPKLISFCLQIQTIPHPLPRFQTRACNQLSVSHPCFANGVWKRWQKKAWVTLALNPRQQRFPYQIQTTLLLRISPFVNVLEFPLPSYNVQLKVALVILFEK